MEEKFKYRFDSNGIMYKYYYGAITFNDITSSWDYAVDNNLIPEETKGFILDYREAYFDINIKEYWRIADNLKKHINIFRNKKIAVISQTPKDVVVITLVETKDDRYATRAFYTPEAAVKWILN